MKTKIKAIRAQIITLPVLLTLCIGMIRADDRESSQYMSHLMSLSKPEAPTVLEEVVLFTAPSSFQRVGIAFAHEGYGKVHWYKKLMVPRDRAEILAAAAANQKVSPTVDSGILFHVEPIPRNLKVMEYRVIIDGLWTFDPLNPRRLTVDGLVYSIFPLPEQKEPFPTEEIPGTLLFTYQGEPGVLVTVGGSFNGWDPFMYELKEVRPGFYRLPLPLPPGVYQYLFFLNGETFIDPNNHRRVYTPEGRAVSEAVVREEKILW